LNAKAEEIEWAKRVLIRGNKIIYDSEAAVYHSHRYSLKQVFQEYFDSGAMLPVVYMNRTVNYHVIDFIKDGLKFVYKNMHLCYIMDIGIGFLMPLL